MADKHNEQTNSFCLEYQRLIKFGTILLQKIHAGETNINISLWATDSIDHILSVMPIDIPEYKKIEELKYLYQKTYLIIPSSVSSDISYILGNLNIAKNVFYCGARGDVKDIPPKNYADIEYEEIKHTKEYVESNITKELIGKEDGRTKNTAMLHTYGRLCHWVYSITKLNKPEDFLAISACARGMLEVFIDLNLFFHDTIENGIEKYFSHEESNKYKNAENITEFRRKHILTMPEEIRPTEKYLQNNPKQKVQKMREGLWGKNRKEKIIVPEHWSNNKVVQRVELLNDHDIFEIYLNTYYYCNWFVHSGYTNIGRHIDEIHLLMGHLYGLSGDMFRKGTYLINKQIPVISEKHIKDMNHIKELSVGRIWGELVEVGKQKYNEDSKHRLDKK